ncbi:Histone-lysine N-methyltransferase set9 [Lobulomyces angularis]|nr:Histone-lysine N-methyltransferase set9 [Lobulomyces angularis]
MVKKNCNWNKKNESNKNSLLAFTDLFAYDDLACDILCDSLFLGFRTHKLKSYDKEHPEEPYKKWFNTERKLFSNILLGIVHSHICFNKNDEVTALNNLLDLILENPHNLCTEQQKIQIKPIIQPYQNFIRTLPEKKLKDLKAHLEKYLLIYHSNAGFELDRTYRYTTETNKKVETCVYATKPWRKGDQMNFCSGMVCSLTDEDEAELEKRDFSLMYSTKYDTTNLFLGPARFANHDCKPNVKFVPSDNGGIRFYVLKDINIGEEICVFYGPDYFGKGNAECMCRSCELASQGHFYNPALAGSSQRETSRTRKKVSINYNINDKFKSYSMSPEKKTNESKSHLISSCFVCGELIREETKDTSAFLSPLIDDYFYEHSCPRCIRHYKLFKVIWPDRIEKYSVSWKTKSAFSLSENKKYMLSFSTKNPDVPRWQLSWVLRDNEWWPAITIPKVLCKEFSELISFQLEDNQKTDEIVALFLDSPIFLISHINAVKKFVLNNKFYSNIKRIRKEKLKEVMKKSICDEELEKMFNEREEIINSLSLLKGKNFTQLNPRKWMKCEKLIKIFLNQNEANFAIKKPVSVCNSDKTYNEADNLPQSTTSINLRSSSPPAKVQNKPKVNNLKDLQVCNHCKAFKNQMVEGDRTIICEKCFKAKCKKCHKCLCHYVYVADRNEVEALSKRTGNNFSEVLNHDADKSESQLIDSHSETLQEHLTNSGDLRLSVFDKNNTNCDEGKLQWISTKEKSYDNKLLDSDFKLEEDFSSDLSDVPSSSNDETEMLSAKMHRGHLPHNLAEKKNARKFISKRKRQPRVEKISRYQRSKKRSNSSSGVLPVAAEGDLIVKYTPWNKFFRIADCCGKKPQAQFKNLRCFSRHYNLKHKSATKATFLYIIEKYGEEVEMPAKNHTGENIAFESYGGLVCEENRQYKKINRRVSRSTTSTIEPLWQRSIPISRTGTITNCIPEKHEKYNDIAKNIINASFDNKNANVLILTQETMGQNIVKKKYTEEKSGSKVFDLSLLTVQDSRDNSPSGIANRLVKRKRKTQERSIRKSVRVQKETKNEVLQNTEH